MSLRRSVNNFFFHSVKHVKLHAKKRIFARNFSALFKKNLQLKHTEFLLRLTATMLCRKQYAEIDLDASKIMILMLKECSGAPKKFEDEELKALLHEDSSQTLGELAQSLGVNHTTVSKRLKVLGMIQKQEHWVPYDLKPRDVERRLFTCEQLLQRQKRKSFCIVS